MKPNLAGLVAAGVLMTSVLAYAGQQWFYPVSVSKNADGSGSMSGTLGSTRNTSDTAMRFGCYYENFGSYQYASCYGYDGTNSGSCSTTNPALTDTISKLQGDAYLWVEFDNSGNCTRVQIGSQSWAAPKAH